MLTSFCNLEIGCSVTGLAGRARVSCESNNHLVFPQLCTPVPLEVLISCRLLLLMNDHSPCYDGGSLPDKFTCYLANVLTRCSSSPQDDEARKLWDNSL